MFGRKILGIEIDPLGGHPLEIDLTLRALPGFAMATGSLSPMHNRHTSALIDNDDVVLVVMQSGAGEVSQHGRTATVDEGEAVLTANGTVATFAAHRPTSVINLRLSRQLLAPHLANLDDLVARPIPKDDRVLQLLVGYATMLNGQSELAMTELRNLVAGHMHDLAALMLGAHDAGAAPAKPACDPAGGGQKQHRCQDRFPWLYHRRYRPKPADLGKLHPAAIRRSRHHVHRLRSRRTAGPLASHAGQPAVPQPRHQRDRL